MRSRIYTIDEIIHALMEYTGWDKSTATYYENNAMKRALDGMHKEYNEILQITREYYEGK